MTIHWSKRASKSYLKTLEKILSKWSVKEAENFENNVFAFINTLSKNKMLCPSSRIANLRKCVLSKQTSLIYKISENSIIIAVFIDNRSKHKY